MAQRMTAAMPPAMADRMAGRHGHSTPLPVVTASIDLKVVGHGHEHRFVPTPDGRLYGKIRYRNRCACGARQHPETATMHGAPRTKLVDGPRCLRCGLPTVEGLADPDNPVHICCADRGLMNWAKAADRRWKAAHR